MEQAERNAVLAAVSVEFDVVQRLGDVQLATKIIVLTKSRDRVY